MSNPSSYGRFIRLCCLVNQQDEINAELNTFKWIFSSDHPTRLACQSIFNPDKY